MTKPFSEDLRERMIAALDAGLSCRKTAERFGVAVSTVVKLRRRVRETGSLAPGRMGGHRPRSLERRRAFILREVRRTPHLTVRGLRDILAELGVEVSRSTVWRFLKREGLSYKKNAVRG